MNKKYYWLKLNIDFFDREEIKLIEGMPNGKDYIIFYMKLLLKSTNTDGRLMFKDIIPYTDEMLATITNTNIDVVRSAVKMFIQLGLMDKLDDGALFMLETQNMIGSETEYARKKREYREKVKQGLLEDKAQDNIETKKDIVRQEIEKEIELDKDKKIEDQEVRPTDSSSIEFKNNFIKLKNIVIQSTGQEEFRINNIMQPAKYKGIDLNTLIDKIQKSDFLMGKTEKKPTINHFTVKSLLDRIVADGYMSNDPKKDNSEEEGWW